MTVLDVYVVVAVLLLVVVTGNMQFFLYMIGPVVMSFETIIF